MAERARPEGAGLPAPPGFLVFGLGNPGPDYEATRHNLGFLVINALARSRGATLGEGPGPSLVCPLAVGEQRGAMAEPLTWMNRAGRAARALVDEFEGPDLSRLLVVTDDLDLPLGRIRFRRSGGNGGHNGLRSMIDELGSSDFPRLRLGIGRPEAGEPGAIVDWVLEPFDPAEREVVDEVVGRAVEAVEFFVGEGIEAAMNRYNAGGGRSETDSDEEPTGE